MINKTMKGVMKLVQDELGMACKDHGSRFNSGHEAYAVIKEECEELDWEGKKINLTLGYMWEDVKNDDQFGDRLSDIEKYATQAACEAIQVAAMAKKAMR